MRLMHVIIYRVLLLTSLIMERISNQTKTIIIGGTEIGKSVLDVSGYMYSIYVVYAVSIYSFHCSTRVAPVGNIYIVDMMKNLYCILKLFYSSV